MPGSIERKRGHRPPGIMKSSKVRTMTFCQIARLFPIPRSPITLDINSFFYRTISDHVSFPANPLFLHRNKNLCISRLRIHTYVWLYIYIYVIQALIVTSCASRYQIRSAPRFKAPQGSVSITVSMILFPPIRSDGGRFPETGTYRSRSRKEEGGGVAQECGGCFWGRVIKYRGVAEDTWLTGASPLIIIRRERYNSRFAFRRKFDRISRPLSLSLSPFRTCAAGYPRVQKPAFPSAPLSSFHSM